MTSGLRVDRPAAGEGTAWMKAGWALFKAWPIPWMGMSALAFLALMAIGSVPGAGGFMVELLSPFLVAGYMSAGQAARAGQPVTFLHLGAGFQPRPRLSLAMIGAVYLIGILLVDQVMRGMGGEGFQQLARLAQGPQQMSPEEARAVLDQALPALLTGLLLLTPLVMATWFAPALVLFNGFSPLNALWWSLWACAVNWRPLLLYSLLLGMVGVLAVLIPFGLGLLVFMPWVMASTYVAYDAMFRPQPDAPADVPTVA
jgi:hypothetical protein